MKSIELKITRIGNSRGVRIPAPTLARYGIGEHVVMEELTDGILLRPVGPAPAKLSWEDTAREIAASDEAWGEWEATVGDGLEHAPWSAAQPRRVAEAGRAYREPKRRKK